MSTTQTEALKLALEALESCYSTGGIGNDFLYQYYDDDLVTTAITAIKEALSSPNGEAQPEQEPVAWRFQSAVGGWAYGKEPPIGSKYAVEPLYTTPPQRKPLTDAQREEIAKGWRGCNWTVGSIIDAIEAAHGIKGDA